MNLSISNIAWDEKLDQKMFKLLVKYEFSGIEIAPTRIIHENPYERLNEIVEWKENLYNEFGLYVSSMQSIWYGRQERIWGTRQEREFLIEYTKKAILFAERIGCKNLVFGCPQNRVLPDGEDESLAIDFFKELGDYAAKHNTVIAMEANPPIYNTNFINDTKAALDLINKVNSSGFLLNLDVGSMIANGENIGVIADSINLINHIHVSEPGLKKIEKRELHQDLAVLLKQKEYKNFVSIEMGKIEDLNLMEEVIDYIKSIFS